MDFENLVSKKICEYLLMTNTEHNAEIIEYGVQLIVETVFKYCALLLLAITFKQGLACVIFIVLLSGLRVNAGGAHCKTNLGCTLTLFGCFGFGALLNQLEIPLWVSLGICLVAMVVFIKYAPASTVNNPITDSGVRRKKKIRSVLSLLICVVMTLIGEYDGYIVSLVVSEFIAIITIILDKKRKRNMDISL